MKKCGHEYVHVGGCIHCHVYDLEAQLDAANTELEELRELVRDVVDECPLPTYWRGRLRDALAEKVG